MKQNNDGLQGQKSRSADKGQAMRNKKTSASSNMQEGQSGGNTERETNPHPHEQKTPVAKRSK